MYGKCFPQAVGKLSNVNRILKQWYKHTLINALGKTIFTYLLCDTKFTLKFVPFIGFFFFLLLLRG